ncbi:type II secretion system F family protein [Allorhodopirellula solitaria]|uniref:Type II secretion system protein F n=1 Tax=Allorhodopirellula solitaria TaxID=2527987 RepID=A0A5C5YF99_9BACT|nr:type II secretion system F family protein [Allorhodopirellula solitaria]TWT74396.1 Type II secretion system protein F [Allorhodopirellula solitaria]
MRLKAARDFCQRFGTGMHAGVDMLRLLDSESKIGPPRQREAIADLRAEAADGSTLADGMRKRPQFFPPLLRSMTNVGETTGTLERTLFKLAEYYDQQLTLRNNFQRAIAWPAIQFVIGVGVLSLVIWIMGIMNSGGRQMADILGLGLTGTSGVLKFWGILLLFFAAVAAAIVAFQKNVGGIQNAIPLLYKIPGIGSSLQTITLSRFTWTLSLALETGLDPIRAIRLALDSTDSDFYRSGADDAEAAIRGGATLTGALEATSVFPEEFLTQVSVAELSGTDAESISHVARDYDVRAKSAMRVIAGFATGTIWLLVAGFLIFFIIQIVMMIAGAYQDALQGI